LTGCHICLDFGQYQCSNYLKALCSAAPFCCWYEASRDILCDVFLPCLSSFNDKRQQLIKNVLMLVDESVSGWHPKMTKLGGMPITCKEDDEHEYNKDYIKII
jgi:hypothetical protein